MALHLAIRAATRQTVTPQLANSIRMLQLGGAELLAEIDAALAQNVMLESIDETSTDSDFDDIIDMDAVMSPGEPEDTREWDEHIADVRADYIPDREPEHAALEPGLQMRLLAALHLENLPADTRQAAVAVLEEVDEIGRLQASLEEIAEKTALSLQTLQTGLAALRAQAPAGYAAYSLEECLRLQLQAQATSPERDDALAVLEAGLLAVGHFGPEGLRRNLGFDPARFTRALERIRMLEMRPGAEVEEAPAITPDLVVVKHGGQWQIELHASARPRIGINRHYARLVAGMRGGAPELRGQLQDARALMRGLQMRNDTLLKTGRAILRHQFAFLTGGDAAIRPLKLKEIADTIGMHESTVSRVTTGKYVQTPRGLFELRHFFSVTLRGDDEASSAAAKARIHALVNAEDPQAPLSDTELMRALAAENINIVRRTVAKYRSQMEIPNAPLRRLTAASRATRRA
ncbi:MAG: RNA polymerase sigma-54 factor [Nevskiaceae bacterium]|nr:MAG: RNA polymerase sigma-54 factor [Nevskiaceae bacterium]TBR72202.1 MAG: RNA polymerase sigma-54 factor [Nevskiaceae bacterium]